MSELDGGLFQRSDFGMFANECFQYGMRSGCDIDCPVLKRGECELKDDDNKKLYNEYLNSINGNNR